MRSPSKMKIIQIDITNACSHICANCTRLCGHHRKPFFMNFETFKRAVDSMDGWGGTLGVIGGEPTLHPEFARFVEYIAQKFPREEAESYLLEPTTEFYQSNEMEKRSRKFYPTGTENNDYRCPGPGLFSSLNDTYHKYHELIVDSFAFQDLNDHTGLTYHQPVMVTRKDLGIPDDQWYELRDNCWVNNVWSASITPKGAFFCEIAGVLDMIFGGPGGWPIEPGWWKRTPDDFGEQLKWCEWCGLALNTRSRDANDLIDDASPSFYEVLKRIDSPKLKKGMVHVYHKEETAEDDRIRHGTNRQTQFDRVDKNEGAIYPKGFDLIIVDNGDAETTKASGLEQFDNIWVINPNEFGKEINRIFGVSGDDRYVIITEGGIVFTSKFTERMKRYVINPGTLLQMDANSLGDVLLEKVSDKQSAIMLNTMSLSLKRMGYDRLALCKSIADIIECYPINKRIMFDQAMYAESRRICKTTFKQGRKYAIYGAGKYGEKALIDIQKEGSEAVFFVDSSKTKHGQKKCGLDIISPGELISKRNEWDQVVIGAIAYRDIRDTLYGLGLKYEDIVAPIYVVGDFY